MKTVTFTELRKNASGLLTDVEKGKTLIVVRHGKPIAEITPISTSSAWLPAWRKPGLRLAVTGAGLAAAILAERADEDLL